MLAPLDAGSELGNPLAEGIRWRNSSALPQRWMASQRRRSRWELVDQLVHAVSRRGGCIKFFAAGPAVIGARQIAALTVSQFLAGMTTGLRITPLFPLCSQFSGLCPSHGGRMILFRVRQSRYR